MPVHENTAEYVSFTLRNKIYKKLFEKLSTPALKGRNKFFLEFPSSD